MIVLFSFIPILLWFTMTSLLYIAAPVLTLLTLCARALESNRSWRGVTNAHGWHYDFQNNINSVGGGGGGGVVNYPVATNFYLDSGLIPFAVNVPRRTYLPPSDWPDYTGGYRYPSVGRPTIAPPAPASTTGHAPSYLPPPVSTTTEFTLPEVIDAKKRTTFSANSGAIGSKRTFDNTNRNRWNIATAVYRDAHSSELVKIIEMKCDNTIEGRFRAVLRGPELEMSPPVPVFEDAREQTTSRECIVLREGARIQLDLSYSSYAPCGVSDCSDAGSAAFLCVRLRFPIMNGLRLSDDFILTLRCRIQEPIVIHTKRLEMPVSGSVSPRSAGATAVGGASNAVRCQLEVYRRGSTDQFSGRLEPGAVVALGEQLMVRIIIADGDGWQWSRLGGVVLEGGAAEGAEARVTLVTPDGCVVPEASAICPQQPRRESSLAHALLIRAPMFEGTTSGSTVQLSVRVLACRRSYDCVSHCARKKRFLANQHVKEHNDDKYSLTFDRGTNDYADDIQFSNELNNGTFDEKGFEEFRKINSSRVVKSPSKYQDTDITKIRRKRDHESERMTADSLANVAFTVVRPIVNKAESNVKIKGRNDKAVAMVITLSGVVSLLMLAVILAHIYRKRARINDLL